MNVEQIMFSIIRHEVWGKEFQDDIKVFLTSDVYKELYLISTRHDLSHLIASALSKAGLHGDDEVFECFQNSIMMAVYRDGQKEYALEQIGTVLEQGAIPHMPLKGSILRRYYPETWMRTSCDIDVLVHKDDLEKAIQCLCAAGYQLANEFSLHDCSLISPNGVHLELHYLLTTEGCLSKVDDLLQSIWEYTVQDDQNQFRWNMTDELFMIYHVAHMAKHFVNGGCGIRPFVDLWLIKNNMPFDENKLQAMLVDIGLMDFYQGVLALCDVWFGDGVHTQETLSIESYILTGGVYGTATNATIVKTARESKLKGFLSIMFLPRANLEYVYPGLKKHPYLLPFYQIKRWFRVFKKDKRNKVQDLTKARDGVSKEETNLAADLLKHLGLI